MRAPQMQGYGGYRQMPMRMRQQRRAPMMRGYGAPQMQMRGGQRMGFGGQQGFGGSMRGMGGYGGSMGMGGSLGGARLGGSMRGMGGSLGGSRFGGSMHGMGGSRMGGFGGSMGGGSFGGARLGGMGMSGSLGGGSQFGGGRIEHGTDLGSGNLGFTAGDDIQFDHGANAGSFSQGGSSQGGLGGGFGMSRQGMGQGFGGGLGMSGQGMGHGLGGGLGGGLGMSGQGMGQGFSGGFGGQNMNLGRGGLGGGMGRGGKKEISLSLDNTGFKGDFEISDIKKGRGSVQGEHVFDALDRSVMQGIGPRPSDKEEIKKQAQDDIKVYDENLRYNVPIEGRLSDVQKEREGSDS